MSRIISSTLVCACFAWAPLLRAELELVRVWPGYRDAASFTAATEYFGGPTAKSEQLAQRTQPSERAGYYWLVRTKGDTSYHAAKARLEVTRAGSDSSETYEFDWDIPAGKHVTRLGVTGSDWPDADEVPIAWRITIYSTDGTQLASSTSFLWQDS